jgi:hypothetical protein
MLGSTIFTVAYSVVSLLGLWYLVFWLYRGYSVDAFRQDMFDLRDDLFDAARTGLISFDHPAYGLLRSTINGFIRFGHRFTIGQFLFMMLLIKRKDLETIADFDQEWDESISDLNQNTVHCLENFKARMDRIAIKQLIMGTPEFWVVYPLISLCICLWLLWRIGTRQTASFWSFVRNRFFPEIDNAAYFYGRSKEA